MPRTSGESSSIEGQRCLAMRAEKGRRLRVPLYKQTTDFTCGACATLMVWRYFDKKVKLSKQNEFLTWTDIMALPFKFSSPYRIAMFFLKKSFETKLITSETSSDSVARFVCQRVDRAERKLFLRFFKAHNDLLKKRIGSSILHRKPTVADIRSALTARNPVIVLVDSYYTMKDRGMHNAPHAPHWVVVTGYDGGKFHVNDSIHEECRRPGKLMMTDHAIRKAMDTYRRFGWASALIVIAKKVNANPRSNRFSNCERLANEPTHSPKTTFTL
jgi:hypothetical protein